ncbi:hypothetical protein RRG08_006138, partial [Elysia crispata]
MFKKQKTRTSLINFVPAEWSIVCEVTRDHAATSNATCDETAWFTWLTGPRQLVLSGLLSSTEVCRAGRGDPPLPADGRDWQYNAVERHQPQLMEEI